MDGPRNNPTRFNQKTKLGEELDRYRRRPYIDRHRKHERKMGKERKSEKFPPEKIGGPKSRGGPIRRGPETNWGGKRELKNFSQRERGPNKTRRENPGAALYGRALEQI